MDLTFEIQQEENQARRLWRRVFQRLFAPKSTLYIIIGILAISCGLIARTEEIRIVSFVAGILLIVAPLFWFSRIWLIYRGFFRRSGVFENPTTIHLTDTMIETTRGANSSRMEYRVYSNYIPLNDSIALINGDSIAAVFNRSAFPDGGAEFIKCLEASGVKNISTLRVRRWLIVWLYAAFAALAFFICAMSLLSRYSCYRSAMKGLQTCGGHLQQLHQKIVKHATDAEGALPRELSELNLPDEEFGCNFSDATYLYVPYGRLDSSDKASAQTPILIEELGGHWVLSVWGRYTTFTPIVFADGHVAFEKNLYSYTDIHDKYAPLMSPENAEVLKKCCEKWGEDEKQGK